MRDVEPNLTQVRASNSRSFAPSYAAVYAQEFARMDVLILHKTISALNAREHFHKKGSRIKKEREATAWMLKGKTRPQLPVNVHLVRTAPSDGLDGDNLQSALKGVRDQIAEWLRVDDGDTARITFTYDQRRDKPKRYSIEVTFQPRA